MSRYIVCLEGRYFEYSTVVDAPITTTGSLDELRAYIQSEYGQQGMDSLEGRLEGVHKVGHSVRSGSSLQDMLSCNRAGPDESEWTIDEFKAWCRGEIELP